MNRRVLLAAAGVLLILAAVIVGLAWSGSEPALAEAKQHATEPARAAMPARPRVASTLVLDDDVAGTLRLEGQVIDADEHPVGGARVTIDTRPARTVVSEADGSFAFDKLLGRPYELVASAGDDAAGPVSTRLTAHSEPVVLRLKRGAEVQVSVLAAAGRTPIPAAHVELRGAIDLDANTDPTGVVVLRGIPPGVYQLAASSPGHARASTWLMIATGANAHRFELAHGVAVSGRVVDANDRPVAGASVIYEGASDWMQAAGDPVTTDAAGSFQIAALPAGSFRFVARHPEHASGTTDSIVLDGVSPPRAITIRMRAGATIAGVVIDRARASVPYARVRVAEDLVGIQFARTRQTIADANGRFTLAGVPRALVKVVALHEAASSPTTALDLRTSERTTVELMLEIDGQIAGVVVSSTGDPIEGAQVWAAIDPNSARDESRLRGFQQELTDAGGTFAFRGLPPGRYSIRANPPGAADFTTNLMRDEVTAEVGNTALRITLPADGTITGRLAFADGKYPATFAVSLGGWGTSVPVSSSDGAFTLRDVPPRTYQLAVRGPGFAERTIPKVAVEPGKTADLGTITIYKGRSISGRVVDVQGKPVPGAQVLAGAVLFGTGSTTKTPPGFGGPLGAGLLKETVTDERGEFTLVGVGRGPRHLVANHDTLGRSLPVSLTGPIDQSAMTVQLVVLGFGSLAGTITMRGEPAGRVIVTAQSKTVAESMYSVITGADGTYRFDRLAPDGYLVSAMLGRDPISGFGMYSKTVRVASDRVTTLDVTVDAGTTTVVVKPVATGRPVSFALIESVRGTFEATVYKDLQRQLAGREQGQSNFAISLGGNPVRIERLAAGEYTMCAVPYPDEVKALEAEEYILREGDKLPVFCRSITITGAPEQLLDIPVKVPAYVPPPGDGET